MDRRDERADGWAVMEVINDSHIITIPELHRLLLATHALHFTNLLYSYNTVMARIETAVKRYISIHIRFGIHTQSAERQSVWQQHHVGSGQTNAARKLYEAVV